MRQVFEIRESEGKISGAEDYFKSIKKVNINNVLSIFIVSNKKTKGN